MSISPVGLSATKFRTRSTESPKSNNKMSRSCCSDSAGYCFANAAAGGFDLTSTMYPPFGVGNIINTLIGPYDIQFAARCVPVKQSVLNPTFQNIFAEHGEGSIPPLDLDSGIMFGDVCALNLDDFVARHGHAPSLPTIRTHAQRGLFQPIAPWLHSHPFFWFGAIIKEPRETLKC